MTQHFDKSTDFILGYSQYEKRPGLLNLFIRYETLQTAILYFSSAIGKDPYMGVGRNLAYRKELFISNKGFKGYYEKVGGDDDMFVNKHAHKHNTKSILESNSIVYSIPKTSFKSFFRQKIRHLSVGKHYKFRHRLKIGVFFISKFIFWLSLIWLLILPGFKWEIIVSSISLFGLLILQFYMSAKKMGDKFEIYYVLIMDLLYVLYLLGFGMVALLKKRIPWI